MIDITPADAKLLAEKGWRWSGHTHPTPYDGLSIAPSKGDTQVLAAFKQAESAIINVIGTIRRFTKMGGI